VLGQIPQAIKDIPGIRLIERELQETETQGSQVQTFISEKLTHFPSIDNRTKNSLLDKVPKKWTLYPPLLLINNRDTFESDEWIQFFDQHKDIDRHLFFTEFLSACFAPNVTHIAVNKPIVEQDIMRRPFALVPIHGQFGPEPTPTIFDSPSDRDFDEALWCSTVQNGIRQTWAPRYTMFSRGNIKEKKRILDTFVEVRGNCIVDLYAGIGYFTLSYLKLGAKHVFCFELNPWSIQGLIRGVLANGFSYKLTRRDEKFVYDPQVQVFIFHESNEFAESRFEQIETQLPITHINLGLLPTSKPSWSIAHAISHRFSTALSCDIHIHENIHVDQLDAFMDLTSSELLQIAPSEDVLIEPLHLEKIKTFAPDVWHICADFKLIKLL
jgi:tRNA wybutosine-synthesizing protein 2